MDARADRSLVNVYDVSHVNGDIFEIEAEFYERQGNDLVFYAVGLEVFRASWLDVLGVSKSALWRKPVADPVEELWL